MKRVVNVRRSLLVIPVLLLGSTKANAQHTEFNLMGGMNLSHYVTRGEEEPYYSMIDMTTYSSYANNSFGNQNEFAYQFSVGLKKVTPRLFLWGINLEYEKIKCRKRINWVYGPPDHNTSYDTLRTAKGYASLSNSFLALNPYIGYRFKLKKFYWDIMGGLDIAISIAPPHHQGRAKIEANNQVTKYNTKSKKHSYHPFETRARLQTELHYLKWGLYLGYSWGFYHGTLRTMGAIPPNSYVRCFRAGIFYKLE